LPNPRQCPRMKGRDREVSSKVEKVAEFMNVLGQIMGIREAAAKWGLQQEEVERLCREGVVRAVCLDGEDGPWVLVKDQPNPVTGEGLPRQQRVSADKTSYMSSKLLDALYE
jgi:hypothetical protein